jgi:Neuraminidase (sialidase)
LLFVFYFPCISLSRGILLSIVSVLGTEMMHLNKNKNNNYKVTAATFLTLATMILVAGTAVIVPSALHPASAVRLVTEDGITERSARAPSVVTGENVYIAWWNGTAGEPDVQTDVMFRASTDGGATFSDKINLSNTTDADSWRVEIAGEGDTVVVSWWETNQTSDIPVARISTDAGETFGPMLRLATNGTISGTEEEGAAAGEEEEGETIEEEAVGGTEVAE